jgi:hypothetical protein
VDPLDVQGRDHIAARQNEEADKEEVQTQNSPGGTSSGTSEDDSGTDVGIDGPYEVKNFSLQDIDPGEPITSDMSREEQRERARRWAEEQLGGSLVEEWRFDEEPISDQELRQTKRKELSDRKERLRDHSRLARDIMYELKNSISEELPEGIDQRRHALQYESIVAKNGVEQIHEELSERYSYSHQEHAIWKKLRDVKKGRVGSRLGEDIPEEQARAKALDKVKRVYDSLNSEQQRGIRTRIETSEDWEPGLDLLEEALRESRLSANDLKVERRLRESLMVASQTPPARDEYQQALDRVKRHFESLSTQGKERVRSELDEEQERHLDRALSKRRRTLGEAAGDDQGRKDSSGDRTTESKRSEKDRSTQDRSGGKDTGQGDGPSGGSSRDDSSRDGPSRDSAGDTQRDGGKDESKYDKGMGYGL